MTITDISEKQAEERKREKRLVHLTNSLSKDFTGSQKFKVKAQKTFAEYLIKSFLDYVFFDLHKEIGEITEGHIRDFMLEHAPQKLSIDKESAKTVPDTMTGFIDYAEKEGYLKNAALLNGTIMANAKPCIKLVHDKKQKVESRPAIATGAVMTEPKVGRNDPCPCGSGKKYKKCCGLKATK